MQGPRQYRVYKATLVSKAQIHVLPPGIPACKGVPWTLLNAGELPVCDSGQLPGVRSNENLRCRVLLPHLKVAQHLPSFKDGRQQESGIQPEGHGGQPQICEPSGLETGWSRVKVDYLIHMHDVKVGAQQPQCGTSGAKRALC